MKRKRKRMGQEQNSEKKKIGQNLPTNKVHKKQQQQQHDLPNERMKEIHIEWNLLFQ